jgi:hypothetical protein
MENTKRKVTRVAAREAERIMISANDYLVRSRSQDHQVIAYSGTQAFRNLCDACDLLREGRNNARMLSI